MKLTTILSLVLSSQMATAFVPAGLQRRSQTLTAQQPSPSTTKLSPLVVGMAPNQSLEMDEENSASRITSKKRTTDPTPVLYSFLKDNLGFDTTKGAIAASALALLLLVAPLTADAAMSGGRMGGSFSAPRSMPSRSYSGGGGYGYGGGRTVIVPSRPNVYVAPMITPFYNPFYNPYSYGGGGVITYGGGGGFFNLFALGFGAFALMSILPSILAPSRIFSNDMDWSGPATSALGSGTSVVQISVAMQVPNRDDPNSILSVLQRISQTAQTDSRVGIQNLTSQVAVELLRRKSAMTAAFTSSTHHRTREQAQRDYNQVSVRERSKFEQESVNKYGGVDYAASKRAGRSSSSGIDGATMAVITLVMAIDGDSTKLRQISSVKDVEEALRKIAADAKVDDCLQSVEILWTPEERSETLTARDVIADYPELRSI